MTVDKILLNIDILKKIFNYKGVKNTLQNSKNNNKELHLSHFFGKKSRLHSFQIILPGNFLFAALGFI